MKKGEIWLVNFDPALGHEFQKVRPALVLQSVKIASKLITVMPLSSQVSNKSTSDIFLKKDSKNRLFADSLIKVQQISSFDKKRLIHYVGVVSQKTLKQIDKYIKEHFNLS